MAMGLFRGTALGALCAAALVVGGCGGNDGPAPVLLAGDWSGSLSIAYDNGGASAGALGVTFAQEQAFVSGVALWSPHGGSQSLTGPIDGFNVTLLLHFRCLDKSETTTLTGSVEGATLNITGASGVACPGGGAGLVVAGASGALTHTSDFSPL